MEGAKSYSNAFRMEFEKVHEYGFNASTFEIKVRTPK